MWSVFFLLFSGLCLSDCRVGGEIERERVNVERCDGTMMVTGSRAPFFFFHF